MWKFYVTPTRFKLFEHGISLYKYLNMSFFIGFSKIWKDPTLGLVLKYVRGGRRKLWWPPNIFGPNRKGASNIFGPSRGFAEFILTKLGKGIYFFSPLWSMKISYFISMEITDQSFFFADTTPTKFKAWLRKICT